VRRQIEGTADDKPERVGGEMQGKVCVVTGVSGGIGKAAAAGLARRGATVALVAPRADAGQEARAGRAHLFPGSLQNWQ
jgi:retinol dehydrogenase 12